MAEVEKKDMVYVRLRDVGSLVNDTKQGVSIVGKKPVHVERTAFINRAIAANVLVILEEKVALKEIAEYEKTRKAVIETEKKALEVKPKQATPLEPAVDTEQTITQPKGAGEEASGNSDTSDTDSGKDGDGKPLEDAPEGGDAPNAEEAAKGEEAPAVDADKAPEGADAPAAPVQEEPADEEDEKPDYMAWTNDALIAELKSRKIDFSGASKKAEYAALLTMDDEK